MTQPAASKWLYRIPIWVGIYRSILIFDRYTQYYEKSIWRSWIDVFARQHFFFLTPNPESEGSTIWTISIGLQYASSCGAKEWIRKMIKPCNLEIDVPVLDRYIGNWCMHASWFNIYRSIIDIWWRVLEWWDGSTTIMPFKMMVNCTRTSTWIDVTHLHGSAQWHEESWVMDCDMQNHVLARLLCSAHAENHLERQHHHSRDHLVQLVDPACMDDACMR